ncbi:MAG: spore maturation protein [Lachnospiraceae bacterium]|nr:spore maturation protein [Lachnospiraceae bacterium]
MNLLTYISDSIVPLIFFVITGYALIKGNSVFDDFVEGAKDGFAVVRDILPTLIGLMLAVGILRASGVLDMLAKLFAPVANVVCFPSELVPIVTAKMFSSSAATGLLLDIYKEYGPDSYLGFLASVLMSCSETIFYTVSVYFGTVQIKKIRYTVWGALFATLAGIIGSIIVTNCYGIR